MYRSVVHFFKTLSPCCDADLSWPGSHVPRCSVHTVAPRLCSANLSWADHADHANSTDSSGGKGHSRPICEHSHAVSATLGTSAASSPPSHSSAMPCTTHVSTGALTCHMHAVPTSSSLQKKQVLQHELHGRSHCMPEHVHSLQSTDSKAANQ